MKTRNFFAVRLACTLWSAIALVTMAAPLNGAGSTFAEPLYRKWAGMDQPLGGLQYDGVGSGEGVARIVSSKAEFGASDEPLTRTLLEQKGLRQFPTVMGAIVVVVNLPGVPGGEMKVSPEVLAKIYTGQIVRWNDPAIVALNDAPGVKLPNLAIKPFYRADASGSTFVLTYFLSARVPQWRDGPGVDKLIRGAVGQGVKGTGAVVSAVRQTPGAIGYVDFGRARSEGMNMVQLPNRVGVFVKPTVESIQESARVDAEQLIYSSDPDFYLVLTDSNTYRGWPLATATFVVLPRNVRDARRVLDFIYWGYRYGDAAARELGYVPLSETLKLTVRRAWARQFGYKAGA